MEKSSSSSNDPPGLDLTLGCGSNNSESSSDNNKAGPSTSAANSSHPSTSARGSSVSQSSPIITLNISTTTGGNFTVQVDISNTVLALKKIVSKKLKVAKERICLLHRERELQEGTLQENGIIDGSKIILIPNVETGLLAQRPENTVMQALESLNDNQVNDFLSGKTPLNLSMRLGDHMMLIQLQLSTVTPTSASSSGSQRSSRSSMKSRVTSSSSTSTAGPSSHSTSSTSTSTSTSSKSGTAQQCVYTQTPMTMRTSRSRTISVDMDNNPLMTSSSPTSPAYSGATLNNSSSSSCNPLPDSPASPTVVSLPVTLASPKLREPTLTVDDFERLKNIFTASEMADTPPSSSHASSASTSTACSPVVLNYSEDSPMLDQSPIKSLSNLVSSPIQTTPLKSYPTNPEPTESPSTIPKTSEDLSKFAHCICKQLRSAARGGDPGAATPSTSKSSLHRTHHNPISRKRHSCPTASNVMLFRRTKSSDHIRPQPHQPQPNPPTSQTTPDSTAITPNPPGTLAEASRNLTQTLRKLSKEVFTNKSDPNHTSNVIAQHRQHLQSTANAQRKAAAANGGSAPSAPTSGAVIESMKNHGKGIYSGTFSGTLNPALQDRNGRPKRDISTVIHILNDLLSATPHYTRGARICFEPTTTTSSSSRSNKQSSSSNRHPITSTQVQSPTNCSKCNALLTVKPSPMSTPRCPTGECAGHLDRTPESPHIVSPIDLTPAQRCRCSRALQFEDDDDTKSVLPPTTPIGCHCPPTADVQSTNEPMDEGSAPICTKCRAVERENSQTKNKLDQLRLVMQQKKARREARKLQSAPYSPSAGSAAARLLAAASAATTAQNANTLATDPTSSTTSSNGAGATTTATIASTADVATGGSINNLVEEVDTAA